MQIIRESKLREFNEGKWSNRCPSCHSADSSVLGPVGKCFHFCTTQFDYPVNASNLIECKNCSFLYKNPCLEKNTLRKLYENQPADIWQAAACFAPRSDFELIREYVNSCGREFNNVLDVGCYNGVFLSELKKRCAALSSARLFGVEPSAGARLEAERNGVRVIGSDCVDIDWRAQVYDLAILVDVYEHVQNIDSVIEEIWARLSSGGRIIVTTGIALSSGRTSNYRDNYYVGMSEHLNFLSLPHVKWLATRLGCRDFELHCFSHGVRFSAYSAIKILAKNLIFRLDKVMRHSGIIQAIRVTEALIKKYNIVGIRPIIRTKDHAFLVLKKG
jgi:SAM-dependent methyltransferase